MTELATIRWGDVQSIAIPVGGVPGGITVNDQRFITKQLVNANWRVPMSWNTLLFAFPQFTTTENATLTVQWLFALGSGAASSSEVPLFTMTLAPTGGVYSLVQQQQLVPAQFMTIRARLLGSPDTAGAESVLVGAFVAPNNAEVFESEAMADALRDHLDSEERRWMGRTIHDPDDAFVEEGMYYQPVRRARHRG